MSDYIMTYTGIHFYPVDPRIEDINIRDIAHALSYICRGNGQVKNFFSVGQHCIYCAMEARARGYGDRVAMACLLHDASESYMSDVPRPFKKYISEYNEMEEHLLGLIYTKYLGTPLTDEEQSLLKKVDDDLLYFDLKYLLGKNPDTPMPEMHIKISHEFVPFIEIENKYLELFEEINKGLCI